MEERLGIREDYLLALRHFVLVAGRGRGKTSLNAALFDAGVAQFNLVKVSSVLPPAVAERARIELPPGALLPIAYGTISSSEAGLRITAAVAAALPQHQEDHGVIMEYSGDAGPEEARELVIAMAEEAMRLRGLPIREIKTKAVSTEVSGPTAVFAGVALF